MNTITVNWNAVTEDIESQPITVGNYAIYCSNNGGAYTLKTTVTAPATSKVFTSQSPGTYRFKVAAIGNNGVESAQSQETSLITVFDPAQVPPKSPTGATAQLS